MVTVKVFYYSNTQARFILEDRVCTTSMSSIEPFDYALEATDTVLAVFHGMTAINIYIQGKEIVDGVIV